ncbi:G-type lectin S-receptor-like serine/threonine-protein kinase SD1-1 [Turnera subulata]|uniref:non-specific serine/threonine protein kinase n=1 Tax=Turnera subulata TaxID=218843 RepID=A0A9Q0F1F7_9ROSI|nr:G-type lectin S-receptor-like serine/threonine-protein kinase SD1-1 [Turnera subulata]
MGGEGLPSDLFASQVVLNVVVVVFVAVFLRPRRPHLPSNKAIDGDCGCDDGVDDTKERRRKRNAEKQKQIGIIVGAIILTMGVLLLGRILYGRRRKHKSRENMKNILEKYYKTRQNNSEDLELPVIQFSTITKATQNFSSKNKLGKGGFGTVYKGTLSDGQEIAVKRLSINSRQGLEEFINEVMLIVKLQHRNLVKLLGCCVEGDERMLVYEYMPNKSLDYFIFEESKRRILEWERRINIINGIARGLMYLHQDSRLRIIHRDLKASNILLDYEMNPKISDFGMARIFKGNQTEDKTNKVVGTYGYIAPEYAVKGRFSVKSDIFSFGVLVLEILSGKKNRGFSSPDHHHNLLGHAWILWMESRPLELVDDMPCESADGPQIERCIHIGLLCVQNQPEDRPNMSNVVLMLESQILLPQPKQPGFFGESSLLYLQQKMK